jgi:hypothetical protein
MNWTHEDPKLAPCVVVCPVEAFPVTAAHFFNSVNGPDYDYSAVLSASLIMA